MEKQPLAEEIHVTISTRFFMDGTKELNRIHCWSEYLKCTNTEQILDKDSKLTQITYSFLKEDVDELFEKSPHLFV